MTSLVRAEVLPARNQKIAFLTLDRPQALNALNLEILISLREALESWEHDPSIALVVLQSTNPRAFCAGGDVRALADYVSRQAPDQAHANVANFFHIEFGLDERMYSLTKPILCLAEGICMGGGIGLIMGASHRVVSPESILAMPEVAIGYFPDVGSGWTLSRRPGNLGRFLGMSGARFTGKDAVGLKIATHLVSKVSMQRIGTDLLRHSWTRDPAANKSLLDERLQPSLIQEGPSPALDSEAMIEELFAQETFSAFWDKTFQDLKFTPWLQEAITLMRKGAPASVRVAYAQFAPPYQQKSLRLVFQQELNLALQFTRRPDFSEGVRAQLVDKDKNPQWQHKSPLDLSSAEIASYFAALD